MQRNGGRLPVEEAVVVGLHVADALAASHALDVVHRDIKPQNLLVDGFGQVKVCDFGIALLASASQATVTKAFTLNYASPEQLDHRPIGTASDVYSFAATMLHLLTGQPLSFSDRNSANLEHVFRRAGIPASLNDVVRLLLQMLRADPAERPEMSSAVAEFERAVAALGVNRRHLPASAALAPPVLARPQVPPTASNVSAAQPVPSGPITDLAPTAVLPVPLLPEPISRQLSSRGSRGVLIGFACIALGIVALGTWAAGRNDDSESTGTESLPTPTDGVTASAATTPSTASGIVVEPWAIDCLRFAYVQTGAIETSSSTAQEDLATIVAMSRDLLPGGIDASRLHAVDGTCFDRPNVALVLVGGFSTDDEAASVCQQFRANEIAAVSADPSRYPNLNPQGSPPTPAGDQLAIYRIIGSAAARGC